MVWCFFLVHAFLYWFETCCLQITWEWLRQWRSVLWLCEALVLSRFATAWTILLTWYWRGCVTAAFGQSLRACAASVLWCLVSPCHIAVPILLLGVLVVWCLAFLSQFLKLFLRKRLKNVLSLCWRRDPVLGAGVALPPRNTIFIGRTGVMAFWLQRQTFHDPWWGTAP